MGDERTDEVRTTKLTSWKGSTLDNIVHVLDISSKFALNKEVVAKDHHVYSFAFSFIRWRRPEKIYSESVHHFNPDYVEVFTSVRTTSRLYSRSAACPIGAYSKYDLIMNIFLRPEKYEINMSLLCR